MNPNSSQADSSQFMKARFPLSFKILAWLGINLALIMVLGLGVLGAGGGVRDWMRGPVSERLQLVGSALASELYRSSDPEAVLSEYQQTYGLKLAVYAADGSRIAGDDTPLPDQLQRWLSGQRDGRLRGLGDPRGRPGDGDGRLLRPDERPPPRRGEGERRPPRDLDRPGPPIDGEGDRAPLPPAAGAGRIMDEFGDPAQWWGGVRIPIFEAEQDRSRSGALVAVADTALGFGGLLDLRPVVYAVSVVLLVSILFWLPLVMRMTSALRSMMHATSAIAEGRFDTRVPTNRADEIGALGRGINRMAGRLDTLVNGQRKFLADMAHELGSPVGRLQVASSILEERVSADLQPQVADVREEVEQMGELLGELLAFTKAGLQMREASLQPVVLRDVVEQAIVREAADAMVKRLVQSDLVVSGDAKLLVKVVGNLLRNAVRYGGDDVQIEVSARRRENGTIEVSVRDDGPGVPADALERLGEPFFRPDAARSRSVGGTGLGLSIVRESVTAMRGRVEFANVSPHGFVVTIELPDGDLGRFTTP